MAVERAKLCQTDELRWYLRLRTAQWQSKGQDFRSATPPVRIDRRDRAEARLMGRCRWRKLFGRDGGMAEGNRGRRREQSPERRAKKNQSSRITRTKTSLSSLDRGERRVLRLLGGDSMTFFFFSRQRGFLFLGLPQAGPGSLGGCLKSRLIVCWSPGLRIDRTTEPEMRSEDPLPVFISASCNTFSYDAGKICLIAATSKK